MHKIFFYYIGDIKVRNVTYLIFFLIKLFNYINLVHQKFK